MLSVNTRAYELTQELIRSPEEYNVIVKKTETGATLIDAGIHAKGGYLAGRITTEICMGRLATIKILPKKYGTLELISIYVQTDHPVLATLGSQFAGWQIKKGDFFAIGSGPARALALEPKDIYEKIKYKDKSELAIMVLETSREPPVDLIKSFASKCNVSPANLYIILVPTTCLAGSIQISGRIVETGIHKLSKIGVDPLAIENAWGCAPIAPPHPKFSEAMGKTNDVILYGGIAHYTLRHENDDDLRALLERAPSSASKDYGKPFSEIFKEANHDFYKIDPKLFAPSTFIINNITTGTFFKVGEPNIEVLKRALNMTEIETRARASSLSTRSPRNI